VLGRWTIVRRLGEGAMGPVLEVVSTGRTRGALHDVRPELVQEPERLEQWKRAARAFQKLEHANVPHLLSIDEAEGRLCLTFELVEGRSLQYRLDQKEPLSPLEGRNFAHDALSALAALHDHGIIHGDVKPGNFLGSPEGCWKISGFSVGPRETPSSVENSATGSSDGIVRGTPLFMSPELAQGEAPSVASDLYSAGATIFAALVGESPFLRPSVVAILEAHRNAAPPDLGLRVPAVERDLADLVTVLLAKTPSKRPRDALAALALLGRHKTRRRPKSQPMVRVPTEPQAPLSQTLAGDAMIPAVADGPAGAEAPRHPRGVITRSTFRRVVEAVELERGNAIPDLPAGEQIALTALERAPLKLQAWWNKRRGKLKRAALAHSRLGNYAAAGELLLDAGEPILGAEYLLKAGIPLAAAIVFERVGQSERAIDAYTAAGKFEAAAKVASHTGKFECVGRAFERAGHLDRAIHAYRSAGQSLPLAVLYERQGRLMEAAHYYEESKEFTKAGELHERLGRISDAVRLFERAGDMQRVAAVWEAAGNRANASRWRAERELAEGRHVNAAREFERAGMPGRAADIFLAQNLLEDAIRCAEETGDAARVAAIHARVGDFALAAASYAKAGQHQESARCFHEAGDLAAEADALERGGDALSAAEAWRAMGRIEDARRVLAAVPEDSTDRKQARAQLGELEVSSGRSEDAAEAFLEAIEGVEPTAENITSFINAADALAAGDDIDRAFEILSRLKGLPFAPPTVGMFLSELERRRAAREPTASRQGPELVGTEVGHYKALTYSGEGELCWGYEAVHTLLKRSSDLRVLKPSVDPERAKRFFAEARALALSRNPNIQDVYDSQTISGQSFVALEVSSDPSLGSILRGAVGPLPVSRAATIGAGILAGLAAAHLNGVVHGDVRPENVLVAPDDRATLVGFSIARHWSKGSTRRFTRPFAYIAPEQPSQAADQYSCGVILYEMLAGQHPIEPGSDAARPLAETAPNVPAELAAAVMKALDKQLAQRHKDVLAFHRIVARFSTS
jgi:serine/threonine protein kinase/tetratricopeptide (TPR) repeat protein